jgi:RimJ/RimL family protein N-acetyltransferase
MRLVQVDPPMRDAVLAGELGDLTAAPGWPHEGSEAGLSFLDAGGLTYLVVDDEDRIYGDCGTKAPPDADGMVEIGYGLAAPSRGRGLGGSAVSALVDALDERSDVTVIEAEVHIGNEASWRLLERLGFAVVPESTGAFRRYRLSRVQ